ncbi:MAG: response regulator [Treponema sp.]|nr:response regulator [Treponema sp.]
MNQTLLIVQCVSIGALLVEIAYIFKNWKARIHGYLFFYCLATLINNLGYLGVMLARTRADALLALQVSYFGRVWIPYSFLLFGLKQCEKKVSPRVLGALAFFHFATYIMVATAKHHKLYYTSIDFVYSGLHPHLVCTYGIWRNAFMALTIVYTVYFLPVLMRRLLAARNPFTKKRLLFVLIAALVQVLFFVLELCKVADDYDLTMLGYTLAIFFMYIAMFRYDLLDFQELAKDFVVDHLSEAIVAVNVDKKVSFFNERAGELFPRLREAPDQAVEDIRLATNGSETVRINDSIFSLEKNNLYRGKKLAGTAYVFKDETERLAYIKELEAQKQLADAANVAKSSFLARMSHEIRTPITAMLGFDELILRENGDRAILNYARAIQTAGNSLLEMISDILDFSKIEAGKVKIIPDAYDVSGLVTDLVSMIMPRADSKRLALRVQVDANTPETLYGDEVRIKQCALNLLTNAVKYTLDGSVTLTVTFDRIDVDNIYLIVIVSDTGIGIKSDDLERLFSPFERIDEERNRGIEGTGLGLNIVHNLLAAMDSRLDVQSEYGKGSTFSFRVRQQIVSQKKIGDYEAVRQTTRKSTAQYKESFHAPDAKILIVDDTPVNLTVMRGLLKKTLVQIDTAADGVEGLEKTRAEHYDVIFIDHMMPNMDGMEMLAALKKDGGKNDGTPCIALTANAISGAREMYLAAGFDDYLAKPVTGASLEQTVRAHLPAEKVRG